MTLRKIKTVSDLMRYCRMPLWFQRSIRDMKVGDMFILGKYSRPVSRYSSREWLIFPEKGEAAFVAEAWIEKERGRYSFYATWTFPAKPSRPLIMTSGTFRVSKGGVIAFTGNHNAVRPFALVCRYLAYMLNRMTAEDKKIYFSANSSPLFNGIWLDSEFIERKLRAREINGRIERVRINYINYFSAHQLSAIVDAALASGLLPDVSAS